MFEAIGLALHELLGLGAPIADETQYERAIGFVGQVFDTVARDAAHPLGGLVHLLAERIREYDRAIEVVVRPVVRHSHLRRMK